MSRSMRVDRRGMLDSGRPLLEQRKRALHVQYTTLRLLRAAEHLAGSALDQRLYHVRLRRRQPRLGCPNARNLV